MGIVRARDDLCNNAPPRSRPGHRARRPASRFLVVAKGGVPRSPVKSSRRQTAAWAAGRRGRSARCGGGSPDSAGGSRVQPHAYWDGCVDGSAPRRGVGCRRTGGGRCLQNRTAEGVHAGARTDGTCSEKRSATPCCFPRAGGDRSFDRRHSPSWILPRQCQCDRMTNRRPSHIK